MADIKNMIEEIKKMTVVELNDLVKAIEEEFGVSAAAMAVAAPAAGGVYKVYKNRLMKIAFEKLGITFPESDFEGTTAVIFHNSDEVAPAKIALDGFTKYEKKLKLKSGYVSGKYFNTEEITALANIPSREVLVAQLLGLLTNPMRSLAVAISEVAKKNA